MRINTRNTVTARPAPLIAATSNRPTTRTANGAPAYTREAQGELFLLATTTLWQEDTFNEKGNARADRLIDLVHEIAVKDFIWLSKFAAWLRGPGNIRTASIVIAAEAVKARLDAGITEVVCSAPGKCMQCKGWPSWRDRSPLSSMVHGDHYTHRKLVNSVLQRADEPGEMIAYWLSKYGKTKPIPISIKRGIADAIERLWNQRAFLKWDSEAKAIRFGDVIDLVQPAYHNKTPEGSWQYELMGYALAKRHGRDEITISDKLAMIRERVRLMGTQVANRRRILLSDTGPDRLAAAGMTWESLAGWLQGPMDAKAWEAVIPSMGYMALLRNLRNFDQAGISDFSVEYVNSKLADPEEVAKSRQLPYRFLSAYMATDSLQWATALDKGMTGSVANIPSLGGRTLVLIDTSGSMTGVMSSKSQVTHLMSAAMFGVALAAKGESVDLYGWADGTFKHEVRKGASVLRETQRFCARSGEVGHGTQLMQAVARGYNGHDRIVIISDMQTSDVLRWDRGSSTTLPANVNIFGFNTIGHAATPFSANSNMHEFGGLTDATFANISRIESYKSGQWPWEMAQQQVAA